MADNDKKTGDKPEKATSAAEAWREFRKHVEKLTEEGVKGYDRWDKGHQDDHDKPSKGPSA